MTSGAARPPTRVGPPHVARVTVLACAGLVALLAAFLVVAGIVTIWDDPAGGFAMVMAGAVVLAVAELLRWMARSDPPDPLTILVGADDIGFERGGQVVDRVPRAEVGVIVLEEYGRAGVQAVAVRGPHGDLVGRWETGWLGKGSVRPYRALRRHSWPRAIQGDGPMRWVSKDAPAWVRA